MPHGEETGDAAEGMCIVRCSNPRTHLALEGRSLPKEACSSWGNDRAGFLVPRATTLSNHAGSPSWMVIRKDCRPRLRVSKDGVVGVPGDPMRRLHDRYIWQWGQNENHPHSNSAQSSSLSAACSRTCRIITNTNTQSSQVSTPMHSKATESYDCLCIHVLAPLPGVQC